ncbi:site-specific DNA-methyltransferase [Bifidobacterium pseudolongum]|uniref:site-specific DNA-methyltransferase n=1 Tax=Bifidobacterium pseudolongum TaxID=1694 RepID=UPI00101F29CF|nr:site-specific DNA-methyltransferase [Bifidobacterium pseudolongum]RYQ03533.1 DNA methyltransferase [Bifidobacterium pseudolongum subsp. globosum]
MNERPEVKLDQLDTESQNPDSSRAERLRELFPEAVTEGTGDIDFDKLRELLGEHINTGKERYAFTWPGKHEAIRQSQTPSTATLRPLKEKSVDWDTTENLYIEGDNLEVLKLLQRSYHGQVDMIYIDPPYNTGNDFVYKDSFGDTIENYREQTGQEHASNPETNGRFHSNWLNMMYPRLRLARELLALTGVIFISIDDHEAKNLRSICDEIFGENNFVDTVIWEKRYSPQNAAQWFSENHDYILVYAKNKETWKPNLLSRTSEMNARYTNRDNDSRGPWKAVDSTAQAGHGTDSQFYKLTLPSGRVVEPPSGRCWVYTKPRMEEMIADNRVWFGEDGNNMPALKRFLSEVKQGTAPQTIWKYTEVGHNQEGKKELKLFFPENVPFDTPKPTRLIRRMLDIATDKNSLVMDFFSGSATTADAVMQANQKDDGQRRYILVQIPEETTSGYGTLCDIGEERIRRAARNLTEEQVDTDQPTLEKTEPAYLDTGFRVFALDSSNLKSDEYTPGQELDIDLVKRGRTNDDLLFEVMLRWGLDLSLPVETKECNRYEYLSVAEGELVCCMNDGLTVEVIEHIVNADDKPRRVFIPDHVFGEQNNLKLNIVDALRRASSEGQEIELRTV